MAKENIEKRKEIASRGGKASQANGNAYTFDSEKGKTAQAQRKDRQK
jgi:hypothetical protein